jgi:hypothetical protein
MAYYLVKAKVKDQSALKAQVESGEIAFMRPFGGELQACMEQMRLDAEGWAVWEEQCFCSPPLKQERAVLDLHFTDLTTEPIKQGEGWSQIEDLPKLL